MKKSIILFAILDVIAIFCLILAYGPYAKFRDLVVTTAMNTKTHQYLAYFLYNKEQINEILSKNYLQEVEEETNENEIDFEENNSIVYESIYEQQILEHDEDTLYKMIEFDEKDFHVYLTAIYDASRVSTVKSKYYGSNGQYLTDMAQENEAIIAINGGGFIDPEGKGTGARAYRTFISNGQVIESSYNYKQPIIGLNENNVLTLGYMTSNEAINKGIRDAVCFGPFLIVNGKSSVVGGNGGYGISPRTGIGQRKDGILLFLTIEGNGNKHGFRGGASVIDMINIFKRYGAYNAANLDGGASSVLAVNGKLHNHPVAYSNSGERCLPNAWILK